MGKCGEKYKEYMGLEAAMKPGRILFSKQPYYHEHLVPEESSAPDHLEALCHTAVAHRLCNDEKTAVPIL